MLIILKYVLYAKMKYQFLRQFQYVALTGLEFTVEIQLASNSRDSLASASPLASAKVCTPPPLENTSLYTAVLSPSQTPLRR